MPYAIRFGRILFITVVILIVIDYIHSQDQNFQSVFSGRLALGTPTEMVKKPCMASDIIATAHLTSPYRPHTDACDGNMDSFYHSVQVESWETQSPFLTIMLDGTYGINKITVVNVHTGGYCDYLPVDCTERIEGAKVEVLTAGKLTNLGNK